MLIDFQTVEALKVFVRFRLVRKELKTIKKS